MSDGVNTMLIDLYVVEVNDAAAQVVFAFTPDAPAVFRVQIAPEWLITCPVGEHYVMVKKEVLDRADLTIGPLR